MIKIQLTISVEYINYISYFRYPSSICKTKDGEIKMLLNQLRKADEPYKLKCSFFQGKEK